MDVIGSILPSDVLDRIRTRWPGELYPTFNEQVDKILVATYGPSQPLLQAVRSLFYDRKLPPDDAQPGDPERVELSARDRERCIIAMLAARDSKANMSFHMFVALMEGVSPSEIAHILLLAGSYAGFPAFADGIQTLTNLLKDLRKYGESAPPAELFQRILNPAAE